MTSKKVVFGLLVLGFASCRLSESPPSSLEPAAPLPVRASRLVLGVSLHYDAGTEDALHPLVKYLEKEMNLPVELRVAEPYVELPALLQKGEVDVAQLAPLAYIQLRKRLPGLQPVVTPVIAGSPTYLGHIYVKESSPIETLEELRGKRIAFVSPDSASGHLFARALVRQRGFDPDDFFGEVRFSGSHVDSIEAVLSEEVDAAAAFDATANWSGPLERPSGLKVVAKTERIPNDCLAARPGYDPGAIEALQRALVSLRPGGKDAESILSTLRVNGWVKTDTTRYDRVESVLAREASDTDTVPLGADSR